MVTSALLAVGTLRAHGGTALWPSENGILRAQPSSKVTIGTHWFQWKDQPLTGRSDGENYQIGFLTITDTPYPEIVAASREVAAKMYERRYGRCALLSP